MSTKSTIFLTSDNEHCYDDCSLQHYENDKFIGNEIVIEFDRKNIDLYTDEDCVVITLTNPNSDIYKKIKSLNERL